MWTFDKFTRKVFATSPSKLARENGFYEAPALGTEIDQTAMEGMLSKLEGEASPIIARWLDTLEECPPGTVVIEDGDRGVMSQYVATQAFRTSEERILLEQGLGYALENTDLQTLHVAMLGDGVIQEAATTILDFVWILARNDSGQPFHTSDHPVVLRTHNHRCLHFFQFPQPGTEVLFPLSSAGMFYAYEREHWHKLAAFDGQVSSVRFTPQLVESDNHAQVGHSRRFVFCYRDEFAFARSFCAAHPELRDEGRERFQQ